jgi:uncharacterized protein (DUF2141 family)
MVAKTTPVRNATRNRSKAFAVLLSVGAILLVAGAARSEDGGKLTVRFSGLEETTGELIVTVANSREMFESEDQAILTSIAPVEGTPLASTP